MKALRLVVGKNGLSVPKVAILIGGPGKRMILHNLFTSPLYINFLDFSTAFVPYPFLIAVLTFE
jgi:hypothetical protein